MPSVGREERGRERERTVRFGVGWARGGRGRSRLVGRRLLSVMVNLEQLSLNPF
jgi:hypothetical protein